MPLFEDDQEIRDFRLVFRKFVAKEITPHVEEWERNRAVPRELWKKMGAQGFLCLSLPEEYGGMGLDFRYSAVVIEELIRGDGFGVGVPLHGDVATPYIYSYGTEDLKKRLLPRTTTGEAICAIGLTEPNTGSDLAAIRTRAVKDGDHYVINGSKTFITNGMFADIVVVACKVGSGGSGKGITLIVVETDTPGFSRGRKLEKMGYHMQDTAELFFEDCRVPEGNLLGEEGQGFKYMMEKLSPGTPGSHRQVPGNGGGVLQGRAQLRKSPRGLRPSHCRASSITPSNWPRWPLKSKSDAPSSTPSSANSSAGRT